MKIHYINILLFALLLNILEHNKRNHNSTIYHKSNTKPIKQHRSLCECELYAPSNYDNDPEMKEVMKNFNRLTSERFREYEERMEDKRKQCKEQYDKETQKIILKEKIQKVLTEKLAELETNIDSNDIPTCICEKAIADKVEKTCLKCGGVLGGGVAPEFGLIGGTALYGISVWKPKAILAAIAAAKQAGKSAGIKAGNSAGIKAVIDGLYDKFFLKSLGGKALQDVISTESFRNPTFLSGAIKAEQTRLCWITDHETNNMFCSLAGHSGDPSWFDKFIEANSETIVKNATKAAADTTSSETARVTTALTTENTGAIEAACNGYTTAIISSIVAIVVIVLVMIIIYLILRYRRKKKMKKKLQYIKLLNQ